MRTASYLLAGVALTLGTAHAQYGKPTGLEIAVETISVNNGCLGVCRTDLNGQERFWVSARATPITVGNPHKLYEFDRQGNLLGTYNQPTNYLGATVNPWGIRDMAFDGQYIYGGGDNSQTLPTPNLVYAFDPVTRAYVPSAAITLIAPPLPVVRALAFNSVTNRFYTSDFGGTAFEFDRTGAFQAQGFQSGAGAMYGASHDVVGNLYWQFGQTGAHLTTIGTVLTAFDIANNIGLGNTNKTYGDLTHNFAATPVGNIGGIAGGLDTYFRNGRFLAIYLTQATPDSIIEVSLELNTGATCSAGGAGPAYHVIQTGAPWAGNPSLSLDVTNAPGFAGGISLLFLSAPGTPIPLPAPFGAGCNLLLGLSPFIFIGNTVIGAGGVGSYPLPLPAGIARETVLTFQSILLNAVFTSGATSQQTSFSTK